MLQRFAAAIAEMRAAGGTEPEIGALIEGALQIYPPELDPELKAMMREELKRAARPQHEAPARLQ